MNAHVVKVRRVKGRFEVLVNFYLDLEGLSEHLDRPEDRWMDRWMGHFSDRPEDHWLDRWMDHFSDHQKGLLGMVDFLVGLIVYFYCF